MARVTVVEIHCDRCKRVEHRPENKGAAPEATGFSALLGRSADSPEVSVTFDDLCAPCERSIRGYLELIGKKPEKLSPDRKKGRKKGASEEETSAPSSANPEAPRGASASASSSRKAGRAS